MMQLKEKMKNAVIAVVVGAVGMVVFGNIWMMDLGRLLYAMAGATFVTSWLLCMIGLGMLLSRKAK